MSVPLAVIVMAAGRGTRTKIGIPKALLPMCGRPLLGCVLDSVAALSPERTLLVLHHGKEEIEAALSDREGLTIVEQGEPKGTGHAVQVAMRELENFNGDVLVVSGDVPLMTARTLGDLVEVRQQTGAIGSILTSFPDDPIGMGRVLRDADDRLLGTREETDCSEEQLMIPEINSGFYCFDSQQLTEVLGRLRNDNAQDEYYITDAAGLLIDGGHEIAALICEDADEAQGVNTLAELSIARTMMQERILLEHLDKGVLIEDPATTFIESDVEIGSGTRVLPCTMIHAGVRIGENCEVGPFARLRASATMEDGAEIGNFVEVKNSTIGAGAKAKHLTYLGDAMIGPKANIGAGTITANYDGKRKSSTTIGKGAFIGSGTVLVAPSEVGDGAMTGAGAIVTRGSEVPKGEVWVGVPARRLKPKVAGGSEES